jgi:hypothetical protein
MHLINTARLGGNIQTTFLVSEDCEGTGTPAGWTDANGTPNWDYTAAPLLGSQSLYLSLAAAAHRSRIDFTDQTEIWTYFRFRVTNGTVSGGNITVAAYAANGGAQANTLNLNASMRFIFDAGPSPTATVSVDTTYHVWFHYQQGTGNNAVIDVGFSTDGIRPTSGANFAQRTDGSRTNLAGRLFLGTTSTNFGLDAIYDKIRVAATQIGNNGT